MKSRNLFVLFVFAVLLVVFGVTAASAALPTASNEGFALPVEFGSNVSLADNVSLPQSFGSICYEEAYTICLVQYAGLLRPSQLRRFCQLTARLQCES